MKELVLGRRDRKAKPRSTGINALIDPGLPIAAFGDLIHSHGGMIDAVKFGWGTAIVTPNLSEKTTMLKDKSIPFWFGGTLFERAYLENRVSDFIDWVRTSGATYFEVSDGTINLPYAERYHLIKDLAHEFLVLAEIGKKDGAVTPAPKAWIDAIHRDLEAGARHVVLEGRESGSAGLYERSGQIRTQLVEDILASTIKSSDLLFEAPVTHQQAFFIKTVGVEVNLGNIAPRDVIGVETLRRGLRGETLHDPMLISATQRKAG